MLRDPIIQNLFPEIFEYEEAVDVIECLKEWPVKKLSTSKEIAKKTKLEEKEVKNILKLLETNNLVYNVKINEICLKLIISIRAGRLDNEAMAKRNKLDVEIVNQFIEKNESVLEEVKKEFTQDNLSKLNDSLNALIKGEKEEPSEEENAADADKEVINEESDDKKDELIKEDLASVEDNKEGSEEDSKAKKAKAKKPKKEKSKTRTVNQKLWYLTFDESIKCLKNGYRTDEDISEKIACKLNIVRKILYKLYDMRLASYKRDKDKETQWYTYDWTFNEAEYKKLEFNLASEELKRLNAELEYEENNMFFVCPFGHYRLDFEDASTVEFLCPECDVDLEFDDNQEKINKKKEEIRILEELISS